MDNTYNEETTGSGLRSQLEEALKVIKDQNKQIESFKQEAQQAKVTSMLSDKGISTKVAKLIPSTIVDSDGLDAWLEEFSDVFGIGNSDNSATVQVDTVTADQGSPSVQPEVVNANKRVNTLNQNAASQEVVHDFEARIRSATTSDEVDSIIKEAQSYFL